MSLHVIAGAGSTGSRAALLLAESGEQVRLLSRRGLGPEHPLVECAAADSTDVNRLTELTTGAATLINTTWPPYNRWPAEFPPIATALLTTAERTGAGYVALSNTYGYGLVDGPMTEATPLHPIAVKGAVRAQMWLDALAAHESGRLRATEVRASAFLGNGAGSLYNMLVTPNLLTGEPAAFPGDLDVAKSWSHIDDVARTLVTVALDNRSWGRPWHVPSNVISVRDLSFRIAAAAGAPTPALTALSRSDMAWMGRTDPIAAEVIEMFYSLDNPDVIDAKLTEQTFGLSATPLDTVIAETIRGALLPG
ncbi:NAD-dependent epimerase/dehydratase family protein [Nocardia huaxiensis]|uniref:NAD-dependent epimerase/dehydratase family protein n=1 Tax=Nocardia huaxiensis TaxID=2755382 RepID=UPI001E4EF3F7|nr:NAD-dependent epimerase/dehydratase family protein [Nocardia huaxiensis]UFS95372.1 NAD-dependent epimerase/dehydratase family protein [Nocardia huaxiensis]